MKHKNKLIWLLAAMVPMCGALLLGSCKKVPQEGSLAPDISYKNRKQYATSGLQQSIGNFQASTSTLPLKFEIVEVRESTGKKTTALNEQIPVLRYKQAIVGNESEEELKLKTETVMVPAVTINPFTGAVEILEGNKISAGEYHLDIRVANTSGGRILKDALVIEFKEFEVKSFSSGMNKAPEIERVGDTPNQIRFVGYLNNVPLAGDQIDFTKDRLAGFKGTFYNDANDGEIWKVNFPVKESNTTCTWRVVNPTTGAVSYVSENFNFVIGLPGSYVVRLYK